MHNIVNRILQQISQRWFPDFSSFQKFAENSAEIIFVNEIWSVYFNAGNWKAMKQRKTLVKNGLTDSFPGSHKECLLVPRLS